MAESSVETQEFPTQESLSRAEKFRRWLKEKFRIGQKTLPANEMAKSSRELPLPIAGGAIDKELLSEDKKDWRTDTTDRLNRAKPIGDNRMTAQDRAVAAGVIGDPKRADIEGRIDESLEDLSKRALEKQNQLRQGKDTRNKTTAPLRNAA